MASTAFSLLDDPEEWPAFGREVPGRTGCWESGVAIEGMHCSTCALTVEAALRAVPGVLWAEVSGASRRARVRWESSATRPSAWLEAIRGAGYGAVPVADLSAHERRRLQSRRALWRWLVAGFCMMQVMMYATPAYVAAPGDITLEAQQLMRWASWVLTLPVLVFSCGPFFGQAWRDLRARRIGMDLPVALGILVTFAVGTAATFDAQGPFGSEVYFDSLTMFVFFLLTGRWLEARLHERTAGALDAVIERLPDGAARVLPDGTLERVALRRLRVGDLVQVHPGEAFPADGLLTRGQTQVDEALITGESQAQPRASGAPVLAGSYNLAGTVQMRVERLGIDTRYAEIVALMQGAAVDKPALAQLADRIAKPFLVAVLAAAALACAFWWPSDPARALMVAVAVLVVTCPCALSLATPAAMLAAAGALARRGVLVRRLQALESLAQVDLVVFDKTGTLTSDALALADVHCREGFAPSQVLAMAGALAAGSRHPVAQAIARAAGSGGAASTWRAEELVEVAGQGVGALACPADGSAPPRPLRLGSAAFCGLERGLAEAGSSTVALLADDRGWLATFSLREALRPDAAQAVQALRAQGVAVRMLSGDRPEAVARIAAQAGIDDARGHCTPQDKLQALRQAQAEGRRIAMVGDGLNDGPVLAGADVSFSFGQAVPLAQAQADFVLLSPRVGDVVQAWLLARRTLRVVRQNLLWAAAYNAVCVPLAAFGLLPAWAAGLGMAASSLLVVANALRLARPPAAAPEAGA